MKQFKKTFLIVTAFIFCLIPFLTTTLEARAEGDARTYYVKYLPDSNKWQYEIGFWTDNGNHLDLSNLNNSIANGDLLVIDGTNNQGIELKVNVHLNNLTIVNGDLANITANGIDNFYALNNSKSVVNGDVTNAYVYDMCLVNFNNNVTNLDIIHTKRDYAEATISVVGTLNRLTATGATKKLFEYYNFSASSLRIVDGRLKTDPANYSTTPVDAATPAETTPASTTTTTSDSEYDDVPKTADTRFNPLWLVGIAAICFAGSYRLKKEK